MCFPCQGRCTNKLNHPFSFSLSLRSGEREPAPDPTLGNTEPITDDLLGFSDRFVKKNVLLLIVQFSHIGDPFPYGGTVGPPAKHPSSSGLVVNPPLITRKTPCSLNFLTFFLLPPSAAQKNQQSLFHPARAAGVRICSVN